MWLQNSESARIESTSETRKKNSEENLQQKIDHIAKSYFGVKISKTGEDLVV